MVTDIIRNSRITQLCMLIKKAIEQKEIRGEIIKDRLIELIIDRWKVSAETAKDYIRDAELKLNIKINPKKWTEDELKHFQHYDWGEEQSIGGLQREFESKPFNWVAALAELKEIILTETDPTEIAILNAEIKRAEEVIAKLK